MRYILYKVFLTFLLTSILVQSVACKDEEESDPLRGLIITSLIAYSYDPNAGLIGSFAGKWTFDPVITAGITANLTVEMSG